MLETCAVPPGVHGEREGGRLSALSSYGILDTPPEAPYDAITRLAAEHFGVEVALLGFVDATRVCIKSHWGTPVRELPRASSLFDDVVMQDGPVIIADLSDHSQRRHREHVLQRFNASFFAGVPIRSANGSVVGALTLLGCSPRLAFSADDLQMLHSLADMVTSQMERARLSRSSTQHRPRPARVRRAAENCPWPRAVDLRVALERREFVLHYQPEIDLKTRCIVGVEALIRWEHPERGLLPPGEFIPRAEENGMILPIGDWGLAEACHQIQAWNDEDPCNESLRVCVNLSARQFSREGLADHVESLLAQTGTASHQLGLEMTESSLIPNMSTAIDVLSGLRTLGVSLHMDDFGTGYSSLSYLHSFPFDVLKVDRSFVGRMTDGDQALQIVRTIVELARVLGMDVVAEGIESHEQYRLLQQLGCRYGQGYLFAKPMKAQEISELLRAPGRILPDLDEETEAACLA